MSRSRAARAGLSRRLRCASCGAVLAVAGGATSALGYASGRIRTKACCLGCGAAACATHRAGEAPSAVAMARALAKGPESV